MCSINVAYPKTSITVLGRVLSDTIMAIEYLVWYSQDFDHMFNCNGRFEIIVLYPSMHRLRHTVALDIYSLAIIYGNGVHIKLTLNCAEVAIWMLIQLSLGLLSYIYCCINVIIKAIS